MHREVGAYFAQKGGQFLIAYGPRSADTARGAVDAGLSHDKIVRIPDITSPEAPAIAAEAALLTLGKNDVLLIKASRAVRAELIVDALRGTEEKTTEQRQS